MVHVLTVIVFARCVLFLGAGEFTGGSGDLNIAGRGAEGDLDFVAGLDVLLEVHEHDVLATGLELKLFTGGDYKAAFFFFHAHSALAVGRGLVQFHGSGNIGFSISDDDLLFAFVIDCGEDTGHALVLGHGLCPRFVDLENVSGNRIRTAAGQGQGCGSESSQKGLAEFHDCPFAPAHGCTNRGHAPREAARGRGILRPARGPLPRGRMRASSRKSRACHTAAGGPRTDTELKRSEVPGLRVRNTPGR